MSHHFPVHVSQQLSVRINADRDQIRRYRPSRSHRSQLQATPSQRIRRQITQHTKRQITRSPALPARRQVHSPCHLLLDSGHAVLGRLDVILRRTLSDCFSSTPDSDRYMDMDRAVHTPMPMPDARQVQTRPLRCRQVLDWRRDPSLARQSRVRRKRWLYLDPVYFQSLGYTQISAFLEYQQEA